MNATALRCAACLQAFPQESWAAQRDLVCPSCGAASRLAVFPAIFRNPAGPEPDPIAGETEASCFYHPRNRALAPCQECGRFLCSLCELGADGRRICPLCFAAGLRARSLQEFETRRTNYDTVALALATAPLILIWPVVFTAPASLFLVFKNWSSPRGILRRSRLRYYLAALVALAEIGAVATLIVQLVRTR
jgi:DNA-directed RNA polymerase subunit RPC12/RpoP